MKKVDIKSFLIGVLVTTNLFFITGFTSSNTDRYDIDDVMKRVKRIENYVISIEDIVNITESDVSFMKRWGVTCN